MALLGYQEIETVKREFARLANPVTVTVFSQSLGSETCYHTERLVKEVAECSEEITVRVLNLVLDRQQAEAYGVDRVPAIVVEGARDYGIRFFGLPSGYEFTSFIDAIVAASTGETPLAQETLDALAGLTAPVHIKVFATPG